MKMIIVIPSYNFIEGIKWNLEFINENYKFDFEAVVVDNMSTNQNDIIKLTKLYDWCSFIENTHKNNLRKSLQLGKEFSDNNNGEIIHVVETDAILNMDTINTMYDVFKEEYSNNIASVSAMYKDGTRDCYPTHRHWHTDAIYKKHPQHGVIRQTNAGVPFLCSMWNSQMFSFLNEVNTTVIHVDRDLGKLVSAKGFKHLRLYDYNIGHYKGGKNSRK